MNENGITIRRLGPSDATLTTLEQLRLMYAELAPGKESGLSLSQLTELLVMPTVFFFIAEEDRPETKRMIGMLTLVHMVTLIAMRGYIEDVAVLSEYRGRRIAWALMNEALRVARGFRYGTGLAYLTPGSRSGQCLLSKVWVSPS